MNKLESKKLVKGALLLTLAGIISKLLSASYRIPLQNLTGDIGYYVYQQIYPLLGVAMTLALYGFPTAIAKMSGDLRAEGKSLSLTGFLLPVFFVLAAINGTVFLFVYMGADLIAYWIGDPNLSAAYRIASFIFLFIPALALLRGLFQGRAEMRPIAVSQITEQVVRVGLIITVTVMITAASGNLYDIGHGAALATIAGMAISTIILLVLFVRSHPISTEKISIPWHYYIKTIVILGLVAAMNHMILLMIQFADTLTLIPNLLDYGLSSTEAMEAKGVFDRGQPLIQLGAVIGSSFALALIPAVSKKEFKRKPNTFYPYINNALLVSFYLAVGATVGLIAIMPEANVLLYLNDQGTGVLRVLVLAIFLSSMAVTSSSILQGTGFIRVTAVFIGITFIMKGIVNELLVPWLGIMGGAIATVLSLALLCIVMMLELKRKIPQLHFLKEINWPALIIAVVAMWVSLEVISLLTPAAIITSRFALFVYLLFNIMIGALIYLFILLRRRAFREEGLDMLPFGHILLKISKGGKGKK